MSKLVTGIELDEKYWKIASVEGSKSQGYRVVFQKKIEDPPFTLSQLMNPDLEDAVFRENLFRWGEKLGEEAGEVLYSGEVVLGLPHEFMSIRLLEVPFSQRARIDRVLPFEAEAAIPFDTEDLVFDHLPLITAESGTKVLAAGLDRDIMAGLLANLKELGIDPPVVTPSALTLQGLLDLAGEEVLDGRTGFLNIGSLTSSLSVSEAGKSVFAMTVRSGMWKLKNGAPESGEEKGEGEEKEKEALPEYEVIPTGMAAEKLAPHLLRAFHYLEGFTPFDGGCPPPIKRLVLVGEGSESDELAGLLAEHLEMEVTRFTLPPSPEGEAQEDGASVAPALALALSRLEARKRAAMNFRKQEFSYRPERKEIMRKSVLPAVLVVLIMIVFGVRSTVRGAGETVEIQKIESQMETTFKKYFPEEPIIDPPRQVSSMIEQAKKKRPLYQDLANLTPLVYLAGISSSIPNDYDVVIESFSYKDNGERVEIKGKSSKLEEANEIVKKLSEVPVFDKVTLDNNTKIRDDEYSFNIKIEHKKEQK